MSLMKLLTRSPPTVECTPMAVATLSFVPTPSALETSTGSLHFLRSSAKRAPKLPMPPSTQGVKVRLAWWRILCLASSATAIFTPASAYFMVGVTRVPRMRNATDDRGVIGARLEQDAGLSGKNARDRRYKVKARFVQQVRKIRFQRTTPGWMMAFA